MKNLIIFLFFSVFALNIFGQDSLALELKNQYDAGKYDEIITEHPNWDNYSAKAIYYLGMANYMKENDAKCIELMNLSISKDTTDSDPYYIKGMTLMYGDNLKEAINSINKAIEIFPESSDYYSSLGDCYFNLEDYNNALTAYQKATEKPKHIDRPYLMIPQVFLSLKKEKEALKAFYIAKEKISKETPSYINLLFNIGLIELLDKNYDEAEKIYEEIISAAPEDYHSYSKLIQIYYGKKEYEKAKPIRAKLYEAHKNNRLDENLKYMFCFDQFNWKDKLVMVFEKFAEPKGELYYKHVFYITNEKGDIEFSIQTENSPISEELGGAKYLIGKNVDNSHYTYPIGFDADFKYEDLKEVVIQILNGEIESGASSHKK